VSKRIATFRNEIIRELPRFNPNDKSSRDLLEKEPLVGLLVHYINWRSRFVARRPRVVRVEPSAANDPRWKSLALEITPFLEKVERGDDLGSHLSDKTRTKGFTPAARGSGPGVDRWADKDFLLHVMGYHHFHLGSKIEKKGFVTRTNDELFAAVSREHFDVIGIFDHSVFDENDQVMTPERERLWDLFIASRTRGSPPGSPMLLSGIATSGHTSQTVFMAQRYARTVQQMDARLDVLTRRRAAWGLALRPSVTCFRQAAHGCAVICRLLDWATVYFPHDSGLCNKFRAHR